MINTLIKNNVNFDVKVGKELESFMFCGNKAQIFGVSITHVTVFGFLACNSLRILKCIVSLTLKTSTNIVGDRPCRYLSISVARL